MFTKVPKFQMLPSRRRLRDAIMPANDNRQSACQRAARPRPRLICRWSVPEGSNRPICAWAVDTSDEPSPSLAADRYRTEVFARTALQQPLTRRSLALRH